MKYSGTLDFDDGDPIEVIALIVRPGEIAFDIVAVWGDLGKWQRDGTAYKSNDYFISNFALSKSTMSQQNGVNCKIMLKINSIDESQVCISGAWIEDNESHRFNGCLEVSS